MSGMTENNLNYLEVIDRKILLVITGAQAKVTIEMLYLETAQLPSIHVISVRRLMYWHTILNRNKEEAISKIYFAMKNKPLKDDWIHHVMKDLEKIGFSIEDEESLSNLDKLSYKALIKKKIKQLSISQYESMKSEHEKVKYIIHTNTNSPQEYLTNGIFTNSQKSLLFNLRSKCDNNFKDNFHNGHQDIKCPLCKLEPDSQEHALSCHIIAEHLYQLEKNIIQGIAYEDLFGDAQAQKKITDIYQSIIRIKKKTLEEYSPYCLPGHKFGT